MLKKWKRAEDASLKAVLFWIISTLSIDEPKHSSHEYNHDYQEKNFEIDQQKDNRGNMRKTERFPLNSHTWIVIALVTSCLVDKTTGISQEEEILLSALLLNISVHYLIWSSWSPDVLLCLLTPLISHTIFPLFLFLPISSGVCILIYFLLFLFLFLLASCFLISRVTLFGNCDSHHHNPGERNLACASITDIQP